MAPSLQIIEGTTSYRTILEENMYVQSILPVQFLLLLFIKSFTCDSGFHITTWKHWYIYGFWTESDVWYHIVNTNDDSHNTLEILSGHITYPENSICVEHPRSRSTRLTPWLSSVSSVDVSVLGLASAIVDYTSVLKMRPPRKIRLYYLLVKNGTCQRHNINVKI